MSSVLYHREVGRACGGQWTVDAYNVRLFDGTMAPDGADGTMIGDPAGDLGEDAGVTTPAIVAASEGIYLTADDPDFGSPVGSSVAEWCVLYRFVTNDSDSPIVCAFEMHRQFDSTNVTVAWSTVSGGVLLLTDPIWYQ